MNFFDLSYPGEMFILWQFNYKKKKKKEVLAGLYLNWAVLAP